jgi:hypothetical protein
MKKCRCRGNSKVTFFNFVMCWLDVNALVVLLMIKTSPRLGYVALQAKQSNATAAIVPLPGPQAIP